jgi:hypothetical protein
MNEHEKHFVPAGDGTFVVVLEPGCLECAQLAIDRALPAPAPIDWPDRFRAAALLADSHELDGGVLSMVTAHLEDWPAEAVQAIGRALLGEDGGQD